MSAPVSGIEAAEQNSAESLLDAFGNLARHFSQPDVGCVCGHLLYVNAGESRARQVALIIMTPR